jgi:adenylyltransferase/sulfurtransferase
MNPSQPIPGDSPLLVIDEADRYSRLRLIPWWRQERLAAARVLVVGAGALGNEVLKNLALLGVGQIHIVDFDRVEPSNLTRSVLFRSEDAGRPKAEVAAVRTRDLNPDVHVVSLQADVIHEVGLGLFLDADLVIGCLDNREARLWVNRQCWKTRTPWIDAGIQEIQGVVKVFVPPDSACYECAMTRRDFELLNLRYSCPLLRRDDLQQGKVPTTPTIASMIAALQVQEALKLLHGMPVAAGSAHVYNGVANRFYTTALPRRDDCLSHEEYPEPLALPLSHQATAAELLEAAGRTLEGPLWLHLERDLIVAWACPACGSRHRVMRPRSQVRQAEAVCPDCGGPAVPDSCSGLDQDDPMVATARLAELGVPAYDIVRVDGRDATGFFLLAGDRDAVGGRNSGGPRDRHPLRDASP